MVAQKIDGTAIAKAIRARLNEEIKQKQEVSPRFKPSLKIIQGKRQVEKTNLKRF
jgi:methylenetetrahydrofolate dehydrogenase (NADP+)/methenyltetrahydrofolate cyclohydrolase/formyltetrahydrofolate synthetase